MNFIDPSGLFIDTILDVGFIMYDLYRLKTEPCDFWWNLAALGLDVVGALLPFVTGLGTLAHGARYAEEGWEASRFADEAWEAAHAICSFTPDTPVATTAGSTPIGDLAVGDTVLAWNDTTGTTGSYTVTAVLVHTDPVITRLTLDGEHITTTPEHPFFTTEHGWTPAGDLHVGDHVRQADGRSGVVQIVAVEHQSQVMYNLTVATAHTFFVGEGQWLVHNTCPILPPREIVNERGVTIEHYYHGNDHGPAHAHVYGNGPSTKIGPNGKPIKGSSELSSTQMKVIQDNKSTIRRAINKAGKWLQYQENIK